MEIGEIFTYVGTALGGGGLVQFANWRINRRKGVAEVKADEIENIRKTMESVYKPLIQQQNERIKELASEVQELREEKRRMQEDYQKQIAKLQEQILNINRALGISARKAILRDRNGRFAKLEDAE